MVGQKAREATGGRASACANGSRSRNSARSDRAGGSKRTDAGNGECGDAQQGSADSAAESALGRSACLVAVVVVAACTALLAMAADDRDAVLVDAGRTQFGHGALGLFLAIEHGAWDTLPDGGLLFGLGRGRICPPSPNPR